tara:strand:+ start:198 stop:518 length:321 start_codon:yes stop_codon:yes gene_type:complete
MDEPIYMLNALWFKPDGGKEKYLEYAAAFAPLLKSIGGKVAKNFTPEETLIGEPGWDPDVFFVVMYPNQAALESMATGPGYEDIKHIREEALDKSLLIRCRPMQWM